MWDEKIHLNFARKSFYVDEKLKKNSKNPQKKKPQPCGKFKLMPNLSTKFGILKKEKEKGGLN
jgi:hypothetical protein